jgi:DNA-binding NtrC family response regulator
VIVAVARVLVVEDDMNVASMLRELLSTLGYAAQIAETGSAAFRLLPQFEPDVVLLDLTLPEMPGEAVLDQLLRTHPHVPVIVMTGNLDPDLAHRVRTRGAFDHVVKPFNLTRLAGLLETALTNRG